MHRRHHVLLAIGLTIAATALSTTPSPAMSKEERARLEHEIRSLDKDKVHKLVQSVEAQPFGDEADQVRAALIVYFEPIPYEVCLDQIGFLMDAKPKLLMNVFWQVVLSSGDFYLQHPDESSDRLAYMQAGLEAGLRVYARILLEKPKARNAKLDELVEMSNAGRLGDYVRDNPCPKK
ncbi:MAG TPA: hypothetical protein VFV19_04735 [Candidatus Polarisedimenticolaceae bacterium]|nr:hypothetical protein [Candidatus Polarisedimenticolaceae bacterium]